MDVSDQAFVAALVIVQTMRFDKVSLLRAYIISEITGLGSGSVRQAVDELLELGVIARSTCKRGRYRLTLYRLANPTVSVAQMPERGQRAIPK